MRTIAFVLLLVLPIFSNAQESQLNTFFEKYSGKEGYTSVYITKYMFELFTKIDEKEKDKDLDNVISKLNSIKILTVDSVTNLKANQKFGKELLSILPKNIYKELMIVKDGGQTITFMIRENGPKISEFVMTVDGSASPVLIFLEGEIDLKHISKLSKSMKIDGFEHLNKIDEKK
jgi:hypothetical protein